MKVVGVHSFSILDYYYFFYVYLYHVYHTGLLSLMKTTKTFSLPNEMNKKLYLFQLILIHLVSKAFSLLKY